MQRTLHRRLRDRESASSIIIYGIFHHKMRYALNGLFFDFFFLFFDIFLLDDTIFLIVY